MDATVAALLISALSLVLAGLSLGWQVAQWLLAGGRPRATLIHGLVDGNSVYSGRVKEGVPHDLSSLRRQGIIGTQVVGIRVTNHGRAPVSISSVAVHTRGGALTLNPLGGLIGPSLPYQLLPGTNETWYVDAVDVAKLASSSREVLNENVQGIYMTAALGTGKSIKTPEFLRA
ncbi:phosphoribosylamine--glycine ligase [Aeromicrobium sp. Marseille-Q0843]|uniref:Phosphoribosylamine--glycine ligase n=1 Tax=Aeromicrobium phoceense TaxID=2754045 RepID=A0A838XD30_9ACTN|nr:phosphoribosylamine--glycine ligase [Aeromicrobium phoceense]MBA4608425.1 phosphoribosylamine--glycine ligase [Aeromicrobium phoceense]